jgi:hypothetical protein
MRGIQKSVHRDIESERRAEVEQRGRSVIGAIQSKHIILPRLSDSLADFLYVYVDFCAQAHIVELMLIVDFGRLLTWISCQTIC